MARVTHDACLTMDDLYCDRYHDDHDNNDVVIVV
jgi:hypothetical protein